MLEQRKITIHEFNAAIRYMKGPCPPKCPDREVYCKRTCKTWAEHEALRKRIYELREKYGAEASAETRHRIRVLKLGQK